MAYRRIAGIVAANHPAEAARHRDTVRRIIAGIRREQIA
jgi:hypothetical protein